MLEPDRSCLPLVDAVSRFLVAHHEAARDDDLFIRVIVSEVAGYKVVGVWKETASGTKDERAERKKVLALAQARKVDVILVTELTRWGRSMLDLFHTLQDLQAWDVSLVAQTGLQFDLRSAQGKLIASLMAALA